MRGDAERQSNIMLAVTPESFIPGDHAGGDASSASGCATTCSSSGSSTSTSPTGPSTPRPSRRTASACWRWTRRASPAGPTRTPSCSTRCSGLARSRPRSRGTHSSAASRTGRGAAGARPSMPARFALQRPGAASSSRPPTTAGRGNLVPSPRASRSRRADCAPSAPSSWAPASLPSGWASPGPPLRRERRPHHRLRALAVVLRRRGQLAGPGLALARLARGPACRRPRAAPPGLRLTPITRRSGRRRAPSAEYRAPGHPANGHDTAVRES